MSESICILHISDLHARLDHRPQIQIRTKALFEDLEYLGVRPDVVLFTGDLAFSGKKEEYELAHELLLKPLSSRLHLNQRRILIIPGNHDVDRNRIDPIHETGLKHSLYSSVIAEKHVDDAKVARGRLKSYYDFLHNYKKHAVNTYDVYTDNLKGVEFGFALLNSAWRCSGDDDKHKLFLTEKQTLFVASHLEACHVRVALVHHPASWLHPSEQKIVVNDLTRQFDLIVSGHLHDVQSTGLVTNVGDCLTFSAPALAADRDPAGYNLYFLDYAERKLLAKFRKFVRPRQAFDRDTDHARDGEMAFSLPLNNSVRYADGALCQSIASVHTAIDADLKRRLSELQNRETPILVRPPLKAIRWENGCRLGERFSRDLIDLAQANVLLYGPSETGKTILLQATATAYNQAAMTAGLKKMAVYVDLEHKQSSDVAAFIESKVREAIREGSRHPNEILLLIDHVAERDDQQYVSIAEFIRRKTNWRAVVTTDNDFIFDSLAPRSEFSGWTFYELQYWGPSRIREFIRQFFAGTNIDGDAAYAFVCNSLRDSDLPATPVVVAMYVSVFHFFGNQVSSLTFLNLLEKIESVRLLSPQGSPSRSPYNKQKVLSVIAKSMFESGEDHIPTQTAVSLVKDYFSSKYLHADPDAYIKDLCDQEMLREDDGNLCFKHYAFFDYYLARACRDEIIDIKEVTADIYNCVRIAHALALYGGLRREDEPLIQRVLGHIESTFPHDPIITLSDLDSYIDDLLMPRNGKGVDEAVSDEAKQRVDYEALDEDYHADRRRYLERRRRRLAIQAPQTRTEELLLFMNGLKAFYNIFRNLENIDGESKILLLDRILDFHMQCNMNLIDFFHRLLPEANWGTVVAYMITLGGQEFLHCNVGSQSLKIPIERAIELTENDFKRLLLLFLYADLRLSEFAHKLERFAGETKSRAAVEMIYIKAQLLIREHDGDSIPASLISLFKVAFEKREKLFGSRSGGEAIGQRYNQALAAVKKEHIVQRQLGHSGK